MKCPYVIKKCTKCGRLLVAYSGNFYVNKSNGKLISQCKKCKNNHSKLIYEIKKDNEKEKKRKKEYYINNVEYRKEYNRKNREKINKRKREYNKTPKGQVIRLNYNNKRRQLQEEQGNGITKDQWLEMMNFFDWKCAYSGKSISKDNRTVDHIKPLSKGGENEIWNLVPMYANYNSSKCNKDMMSWYKQQEFYSEERLHKIYEWVEYAKNKWQ